MKKLAERLFKWYCHPDLYPHIQGDLEEIYHDHCETKGKFRASLIYCLEVILLFRLSLLKSVGQNSFLNHSGMLKNYFKISFRNLLWNKTYTTINVLGLALGLASFLLLSEYVFFERNYDAHLSGSENLYRLTTDQVIADEITVRDAMSFYPSGEALKQEIPEVIGYTSTLKFDPLVFRNGNDLLDENGVLGVDRHFLDLFNYKILFGDTSKMAEPNQLILTRSKALQYFGKENAVGEELLIHSGFERNFQVAAVIEDIPLNTHYKFNILMSISTIQERLDGDSWRGYMYYSYLRLIPGADVEKLRPMLHTLAKKYIGKDTNLVFNLQALREIHLHSDFTFEPEIHGSAKSVGVLVVISIFILFIAWVNYINLSTAKAIDRAKEIGMRKVIGAQRPQLILQFFLESFMINLVAALMAYVLVQLAVPYFNELAGKEILKEVWSNGHLMAQLAIFFLIGTFVSGFYPALLMSGFNPISVLKGKYKNSRNGIVLRKGLVVLQFTITIALITGTLVVVSQVQFMRSKDLGMNTDQVIGFGLPAQKNVTNWKSALEGADNFGNMLMQYGAVTSTAVISNLPGGGSSDINASSGMRIVGLSQFNEGIFYSLGIDEKAIPLLEMELLYGRNFKRELASDLDAVIVNESFFKKLGLKAEEAFIGEKIMFGRNENNDKYEIVGIIKDANRTSLKKEIEPTVYFSDWGYGGGHGYGNMMVKLKPENLSQSLELIRQKWADHFPNDVLQYHFLDDRFARLYVEDQRFGKVFGVFSLLAIFITILGLFGLSSFMAAQRTKEVGVRKVLGASTGHIIGLFYRDILYLIGCSTVIGVPLVFLVMNGWLDNYAHRINFPWWAILLSCGIVLLCSLLTVGYQTYKVAIINPVKSLKYE